MTSACMYACMHVCMYVYVCVRVFPADLNDKYVHVCTYVYVYVCMHACKHACITHIHTDSDAYTHINDRRYTHEEAFHSKCDSIDTFRLPRDFLIL